MFIVAISTNAHLRLWSCADLVLNFFKKKKKQLSVAENVTAVSTLVWPSTQATPPLAPAPAHSRGVVHFAPLKTSSSRRHAPAPAPAPAGCLSTLSRQRSPVSAVLRVRSVRLRRPERISADAVTPLSWPFHDGGVHSNVPKWWLLCRRLVIMKCESAVKPN